MAPDRQRRGALRGDRDGDVSMEPSTRRGRTRSAQPAGEGRSLFARISKKDPRDERRSRRTETKDFQHKLENIPNLDISMGDVPTRPRRTGASTTINGSAATTRPAPGSLVELKVTNWEKNKAASTSNDGGVESLIQWLEKKGTAKLKNRSRQLKIKKSRVEGKVLFISVPSSDAPALLMINNWQWAGTNVSIERAASTSSVTDASNPWRTTEETKQMFLGVLGRRYRQPEKYLDLSLLQQDVELQKGISNQTDAARMFEAMMAVLQKQFSTADEKDAQIISVSLANNLLADLTPVTSLSQALPHILNLDLSNNSFAKLEALENWRTRFPRLQQLNISGNPLIQDEPDYAQRLLTWFPNLRGLDGVQVRTEEEVANKATNVRIPFPIRAAHFQDENGIVENFIVTFFSGFDTDRATLARTYYDAQSDFSFAINTGAPRDPAGTQSTEKQEWERYIKNSRNLKKITQLQARQNRTFRGTDAVTKAFEDLPRSKHPDPRTEPNKWMIECHIQPGLPDPTKPPGQGIVNGFLVTVHGEYNELDHLGTAHKKRSFDRTFILGPTASGGVRVVNDILLVRAYGGAQAFQPDVESIQQAPTNPTAQVTTENMQRMVIEMQKQTGMNYDYAERALTAQNWLFENALAAFREVRAKGGIPAEAWAVPQPA